MNRIFELYYRGRIEISEDLTFCKGILHPLFNISDIRYVEVFFIHFFKISNTRFTNFLEEVPAAGITRGGTAFQLYSDQRKPGAC